MYTRSSKRSVQNSSVIQGKPIKSSAGRQQVSFEDKRTSAIQQQKLIEGIHQSSDTAQTKAKTPTTSSADSNAVVQRYTIVKHGDYQTTDDRQSPMFPSNQLENHRETLEQGKNQSIISKRNWKPRTMDNPPLKVSEKGLLALESTVGQPRVFYGEAGNIQASRQRLINIQSRVTLAEEPGATVTTPKNPKNPDGQTQDLIRVKPVQSPHIDTKTELMDTNACNFVSERITGGKHMVIGNKIGTQKVLGKINVTDGNKFSRILNRMDEHGTTKGFEGRWQNDQSPYLMNTGPISPEVLEYFKPGILGIKVRPSARILRALSVEGVPPELWKQVYEIYNKKSAKNNDLIEGDVFRHITGYFRINDTIRYRNTKDNQHLTKSLGINEMTSPEVGESFSSIALPSPGVIDEKGITGDGIDLTDKNDLELQQIMEEFLLIKSSSEKLGWLAKSQYKKAKGIVQYGDHHASVVAKDGSDTVTFENYNRGGENDMLMDELWEVWFTGAEEFRTDVNMEVRAMLKAIREAEQKPEYDNHMRKLESLRKKKEALSKFQQDFVNITSQVRAKIETNILSEQNELWHFNMYGPANETFEDEKGNTNKQSFHDVWSKSVPNLVTVRTTGLIDDHMKEKLRKKVYHLVYQQIKQDNFANPLPHYDNMRDLWMQNLEIPQTRIEGSDTLITLQEQEQSQGALTPAEQFEAEALFSKNKKLIFTALYLMTHELPFSPKKMYFKNYSNGTLPFV